MTRFYIYFFSFLLFFYSCGQNNSVNKQLLLDTTRQSKLQYDTTKIVIFSTDKSDYLYKNMHVLNLTSADLLETDQILNDCFKINIIQPRSKNSVSIKLSDYKRQYIPYVNKSGQKMVWVNCFCDDEESYWKKEIVEVEDGGYCFFHVTINLTTKTFDQFLMNGYG